METCRTHRLAKISWSLTIIAGAASILAFACQAENRAPEAGNGTDARGDTPGGKAGTKPTPVNLRTTGIYSCPTIDLPLHEVAGNTGLNVDESALTVATRKTFSSYCAACHGATADGTPGYPSLRPAALAGTVKQVVRAGVGSRMPAFGAATIPDEQLAEMVRLIGSRALVGPSGDAQGEYSWSEEHFANVRGEGFSIWRKPDPSGVACSHCHTPDAVDLAIIGYSDATITRRGTKHLPSEDVSKLVAFVHAQRRFFGIGRPCSPDWRPFQPGGEALPGASARQQDVAFGESLPALALLMTTGRVETLIDAKKAAQEFAAIDTRRVRTAVRFPRWAEDRFDGPAHANQNDYMPAFGHAPRDAGAWFAKEDAYLNDPSDENLRPLLDGIGKETTMDPFLPNAPGAVANPRAPFSSSPTSFIVQVSTLKRKSQLVAQHLFRNALKANGDNVFKTRLLFGGKLGRANPFLDLGAHLIEPPTYDQASDKLIYDALPDEAKAEIPTSAGQSVNFISDSMTHAWMTLGMSLDPALMVNGQLSSGAGFMHYWSLRNFGNHPQPDEVNAASFGDHRRFSEPFFYGHRLLSLVEAVEQPTAESARVRGLPPAQSPDPGWFVVHPLLNGGTLYQMQVTVPADATSSQFAAELHLKGNLIRTVLLLQKEKLESGEAVTEGAALLSRLTSMNGFFGPGFAYFASEVDKLAKGGQVAKDHPELVKELTLYGADTLSLITSVTDLVKKAPVK